MSEFSKPAPGETGSLSHRPEGEKPLELPDWSGQRNAPSTLDMDEMLRYCEANLAHVRSFAGWRERRNSGRCRAEFVL